MGKSCSKCRKYCFSPCRSSKRKRRAESECDGRVTQHSGRNQQLQELVLAEVEEGPGSRICELETMLMSMKESHARELQLEKDCLKKAVSELKDSKERDREKFQEQIRQLQMNQKKQTEEEEVEPCPGTKQELESLKAVLEIKNEELQKLHFQISHSCVQSDDVLSMQFQRETLRQRTEDLVMQMQVKNEEIRKYALENEKFKKLLKDKENRLVKLEQEKEQLLYRLNEISPTSPSFNPVFVTSQDLQESAKENFNNSNAKMLHFGD